MKVKLSILLLLLSASIIAQTDSKAKSILDALSSKTKSYQTISASFSYTLENKADDIKETQEGKLITKGDKYNLSIGGQQVISDGKTVWTYLVDAEEVQVTEVPSAEEMEEEDYISPNNIFTMYEKGFRYKFIKDLTSNEKVYHLIHLFPTNPDDKSYHTIKLYVDKEKMRVKKMRVMSKDGSTYTYSIKSFAGNKSIDDSKFKFDSSAHPDVEVIDMR